MLCLMEETGFANRINKSLKLWERIRIKKNQFWYSLNGGRGSTQTRNSHMDSKRQLVFKIFNLMEVATQTLLGDHIFKDIIA